MLFQATKSHCGPELLDVGFSWKKSSMIIIHMYMSTEDPMKLQESSRDKRYVFAVKFCPAVRKLVSD